MSELFPRDIVDSNSYKVEDTQGHIFTDQTVVFNMETTCGQSDDQKEFPHLAWLYIYGSWFPLTVCICLRKAVNRKSTTERLHVRDFFYSACALIYIYDRPKKHNYRFKNEKQTGCLCSVWNMKSESIFSNVSHISLRQHNRHVGYSK